MKATDRITWLLTLAVSAAGCGAGTAGTAPTLAGDDQEQLFCNVAPDELAFAQVPDAISSLADPPLIAPNHVDASYVADSDRVVGMLLDGEPVAVPLNVLRFHEVVNLNRPGIRLAVTYCPLTGSSLVFDRSGVGGAELGVSGVLHHNNLVMFDRADDPSFFTQMWRGTATCGPAAAAGTPLPLSPSVEMRWDAWRRLHPNTVVVSRDTGHPFGYTTNPNLEYERIDNPLLLIPGPIDARRPPKERVLGIPAGGNGGTAFPFEELKRRERLAIPTLNGSVVVFWDRSAEAAVAFSTELDGERLGFVATGRGYADTATGSDWTLDGLAVAGPLVGRRLSPIVDAYASFWFAWSTFHPETSVWSLRDPR